MSVGARMGAIKLTMAMAGTYVGLVRGTDFFHCWVADSIWLDRAESLITK